MEYILDIGRFRRRLAESGYRGLSDFAAKSGVHRNTLNNLLNGGNVLKHSLFAVASHLGLDPLELISPRSSFSCPAEHVDEIRGVVAGLVKSDRDIAVTLLGSRSRDAAREYSDWDIGMSRRPRPLTGREYLALRRLAGDLSENLVRTVDLLNLDQAPRGFLAGIEPPPLFLDGNPQAYSYLLGVIDGVRKGQAD